MWGGRPGLRESPGSAVLGLAWGAGDPARGSPQGTAFQPALAASRKAAAAKIGRPPRIFIDTPDVQSNEVLVKDRDPFVWLAPGLAGDESSYRTHAEGVTRSLKCYFAGNGCADADDLASESILRLVGKLAEGGPPECSLETERRGYLFGIARNVLREWRRRPDARETCLHEEEGLEFSLPPIDLIARQCLELLRKSVDDNLARLSPIEREILNQSELNPEYSSTLAALAKAAGTQAAAMRQRARRARMRFRNLLLASERIADLLRCLGIERVRT